MTEEVCNGNGGAASGRDTRDLLAVAVVAQCAPGHTDVTLPKSAVTSHAASRVRGEVTDVVVSGSR